MRRTLKRQFTICVGGLHKNIRGRMGEIIRNSNDNGNVFFYICRTTNDYGDEGL